MKDSSSLRCARRSNNNSQIGNNAGALGLGGGGGDEG
nr:MAG TPA: hypothetical protein [Caudoviricetes sp.]